MGRAIEGIIAPVWVVVLLAFSEACRDPESGVDPFTNAYRKKEGINLIVCMPGWKACKPDEENEEKIYNIVFRCGQF